MKIVINTRHGGFGLSEAAMIRYAEVRPGVIYDREGTCLTINGEDTYECDLIRADPFLVEVVKELGEAANGEYASLKVVEIPDDVEWEISEYDGAEWIAECHRTWS